MGTIFYIVALAIILIVYHAPAVKVAADEGDMQGTIIEAIECALLVLIIFFACITHVKP
jgi:uncharacterized membrane protein